MHFRNSNLAASAMAPCSHNGGANEILIVILKNLRRMTDVKRAQDVFQGNQGTKRDDQKMQGQDNSVQF
jgi:hypothetical protein